MDTGERGMAARWEDPIDADSVQVCSVNRGISAAQRRKLEHSPFHTSLDLGWWQS